MTALPDTAARATAEAEVPAIKAWASRHGWAVLWLSEELLLRAAAYHPRTNRVVEVTAQCDGYRAIPPVWQFVRPGTDETGKMWVPAPGPGSVFHGNGIICAPWSRLAYADHGGPHGEWGGPAAWLQVGPPNTIAQTIPDMLSTIDIHLQQSPGMME